VPHVFVDDSTLIVSQQAIRTSIASYYQSVLVCGSDGDELVTSHSFVTSHRSRTVLAPRNKLLARAHRDILRAGVNTMHSHLDGWKKVRSISPSHTQWKGL
jgi:hypothetical protein